MDPWCPRYSPVDDHGCQVRTTARAPDHVFPRRTRPDCDGLKLRRPEAPAQWYYNLKAHPECELGGEEFLASEVTDPDDYARVYALAEGVYQGWSDYRLSTDPMGRQIPVFRLRARPAPDPSRRVPGSFAAEGDLPGLQTGA